MMSWDGWCGAYWNAGWLLIAVLSGIVLWLAFAWHAKQRTKRTGGDAAMAILEQRFAQGELTREQYEDMRRTLKL